MRWRQSRIGEKRRIPIGIPHLSDTLWSEGVVFGLAKGGDTILSEESLNEGTRGTWIDYPGNGVTNDWEITFARTFPNVEKFEVDDNTFEDGESQVTFFDVISVDRNGNLHHFCSALSQDHGVVQINIDEETKIEYY